MFVIFKNLYLSNQGLLPHKMILSLLEIVIEETEEIKEEYEGDN